MDAAPDVAVGSPHGFHNRAPVANARHFPPPMHPDGSPVLRRYPRSDNSTHPAVHGHRVVHHRTAAAAAGDDAAEPGDTRDRFRWAQTVVDTDRDRHPFRSTPHSTADCLADPVHCSGGIQSLHLSTFRPDPSALHGQPGPRVAGSGATMRRMKSGGMMVLRGTADADRMRVQMTMMRMDDLQNNNHVQNYQNRKFRFSEGWCWGYYVGGLSFCTWRILVRTERKFRKMVG